MKLELDASIYPIDVIEATSYRFIDRLSVVTYLHGDKHVLDVTCDEGGNEEQLIQLFKKELTDQKLRKQIRTETEQVRNLVIAYAFSRSGLDV